MTGLCIYEKKNKKIILVLVMSPISYLHSHNTHRPSATSNGMAFVYIYCLNN